MYSSEKQVEKLTKYTGEMEVIKLRSCHITTAIERFDYIELAVEFQALQLRKIIEQIVLCSLITNSEEYLEYYQRLGKVWNIQYICNDIEKINPSFLPVAVIDHHTKHVVNNNLDASMTKAELLEIHEKMGKLLHARNPFSEKIDYYQYSTYIGTCNKQIMEYLNTHIIKPYGEDDLVFVVMNSIDHNGQVAANWCTKV